MGWARVAVVNEDWSPLKMVDVECFDIDTGIPITVVTTDLGGIALFNGLPNDQRYFFKPRTRRVSTKVGNRTYTGQVRIQILASSGTNCADALVDPTGQWGSHTTIQAAITAVPLGGLRTIAILPGTYNEALDIPNLAKDYRFIAACRNVARTLPREVAPAEDASVGVPVVIINGASSPAVHIRAPGGVVFEGIQLTSAVTAGTDGTIKLQTGGSGKLRLIDCRVINTTETGRAIHIVTSTADIFVEFSIIQADETARAISGTITGSFFIRDSRIRGYVVSPGMYDDAAGGNEVNISGSGFVASTTGTTAVVNASPIGQFRFINNLVLQTSTGRGISMNISTPSVGVAPAGPVHIKDNTIESQGSGGIGVYVHGAGDVQGQIHDNFFLFWTTAVDLSAADKFSVQGNFYHTVTTPISGTPVPPDPAEVGHALLDGTIHTDTVAQAVTAGSLVYGDDTPKWDELVISVPAANVRNVLGIDNGETVPSWKTALDGTNPADIAASASPGTSLVFAHRDHVHAHPEFASGDLHTDYALDTDLSTHAGTGAAHHALVTLGGGSAAELSLSGQALTLAAVLTPTEHTTIGDSSPHHAKYTGAEAIAAVEGEATLALDGAITEIHGDANFTLSIVSSNPRWTADSGDYLEYNRAGNYFYTNQALEVAENMALAGASLDADRVFNIAPTYTDTATKTVYGGYIELVSTPAAHSGTSHMGLRMIARSSNHAYNYTHATGFVGFQALAQHWGSGALTSLYGTWMFIDINGSGDVAEAFGFKILARTLPGSSGKFTNLYYLHLRAPEKLGTGAADNVYGLYFEDFSFGTSSNYAIYLAGTSGLARQGIWWNGDTNLYRSAANVLKTDDSFVAAGTVSVGTDAVLTRLGANRLTLGNVEMGTWPVAEGFLYIGSAALDHTAAGNYALLQDDNGDTFVNAAPTKSLCLRVNNGTVMKFQAGMLGFYLTAPIAKPTVSGARDEPEGALADLLTELANLGLITNSTTAS